MKNCLFLLFKYHLYHSYSMNFIILFVCHVPAILENFEKKLMQLYFLNSVDLIKIKSSDFFSCTFQVVACRYFEKPWLPLIQVLCSSRGGVFGTQICKGRRPTDIRQILQLTKQIRIGANPLKTY